MLFAFLYCPFHKHANSEVQQPTDFFAAVNHLNGPLRKQYFTLTGSKGHGLGFVVGGFRKKRSKPQSLIHLNTGKLLLAKGHSWVHDHCISNSQ